MAIDALSNLGEDASLLPHLAAHAFIELDGASATMKSRMLIDAVVRHIPPREARTLHGRAARFTRRLHGSDADIAGHWLKAGNGRRAAICFGRAGDDVLYAGAPDLAVRFFDAALSALPASDAQKNTPRVAGWYAGRAVAHWAKGEMHDARADAVAALSLIDDRIGGPNSLPRWIRRSLARTRRTVLAPTPLGKWLVPRDVRAPLVMVSAIRAEMAFFLAKTRDMISATASMTAFASEPRLRARASTRAYLFVGAFTALLGQKGAAHAAWNKARAAGEAANDPIASSHGYLGEALWHTSHGRWREAHELLERAAALYVDVADPAYNKFVETMFALESYFRGDWTASAERFAALHALGVKQGNRSTEAWGLYGQAEALIIARRWNEAETLLNAAEPIVAAMPDLQSQIICKGLRVQIEYAQGRHQRALDAARACLSAAQRLAANNFGSLEGFAAPAEIFLRLALDTRAPEFVRASAHANVKAAVKSLHRFARLHPIAMPRLNLCRALAARLDQHDEMAIRHLRDGLVQARAMDMQFECAKLESELELARG